MGQMTYRFEEIPLTVNGRECLVSGEVEISYQIFGPEPDVGIMQSWAETDPVGPMKVTIFDAESEIEEDRTLQPSDPLYQQIVTMRSGDIASDCLEDSRVSAW